MLFGVGVSCRSLYSILVINIWAVADQFPLLGKRELICLVNRSCNYVVPVWRGFLFLWVIGMGCVIFCGTADAFHIIIKQDLATPRDTGWKLKMGLRSMLVYKTHL